MKLRNTVIIVAAVAMAATIQTAQADFVSLGTGAGGTVTLADLESTAGGDTYGLSIGDKIFSNFSSGVPLNMFDGNGNPANIKVSVSQVGNSYELLWSGLIAQVIDATGSGISGDLTLGYTVTATDGKIFAIDQNYTGGSGGVGLTTLSVAESVIQPGTANVVANSLLNATIHSTSYTADGAVLNPALSSVDVTKDINLSALGSGASIDISVIEQSFEQVPEPTTVIAGALLLLPLGASTLRILRRNRIG